MKSYMNEEITYQVLQSCLDSGAREFVICAGSRNSSFVEALRIEDQVKTYYWPEERSAAFFALGRSKLTKNPVAIITTSGTAAAELFPAAMEAFYSGIPLILITADRPQIFRGSGAPQTAEQVNLYGHYVQFCQDITAINPCNLDKWHQKIPVHLNVCLEEPQKQPAFKGQKLLLKHEKAREPFVDFSDSEEKIEHFLQQVHHPIVIVSMLKPSAREGVVALLLRLQIPVMLEAISGLREDERLRDLKIERTDKILEIAEQAGYPIDGVLRIGGIPTHRIWRDLEYLEDKVKVCGLSERHFSGLSWTRCVAEVSLDSFLQSYIPHKQFEPSKSEKWLSQEKEFLERLHELFEEEPEAEPSLIYELSKQIPQKANLFLGNSLPIREWDLAAIRQERNWVVNANRGVNGIDGQISSFLGMCDPEKANWGIFGDLTALYDMAGLWILPQLKEMSITIVIINNGGGKIFERMYPYREMLNEHQLSFKPLADMWNMDYCHITRVNEGISLGSGQLIEIVPNDAATKRFWIKYGQIDLKSALEYAPSS
jgi:2-succinyl-5-enolpyruvyl-6-hydroxy-3-cyclohexene-1-carboxylate synthase